MAVCLLAVSVTRSLPRVQQGYLILRCVPTNGFSSLPAKSPLATPKTFPLQTIIRNMSAKRLLIVHPSRFTFRRFKKDAHFFIMLAVIPFTLITLYANLFIGPAELTEIPEGYIPKEHEYYKHPVTRWLVQHYQENPQKGHEKTLSLISLEQEKIRLRRLERKVSALQAERQDYQGYQWARETDTKDLMRVHDKADQIFEETFDSLRPFK